ncbi:MAG: hypothetical protein R3F37_15345 [Candidatus Competibacteraceae bacterium]
MLSTALKRRYSLKAILTAALLAIPSASWAMNLEETDTHTLDFDV